MEARFNDGRAALTRTVALTFENGALVFTVDGDGHRWPLRDLSEEALGEAVRLSVAAEPDARLLVDAATWRVARAPGRSLLETARRTRERRLIAALAAAALGVVVFTFVLVPAAAGPLAQATPLAFESALGESFEAQLGLGLKPCKGAEGQRLLMALGEAIEGGDGQPFNIRVRAVQAPFVNAFALPGGTILVTDDLIAKARSPDELSAVIAHEVAHVERRHVMQAVWRNLGLGLALDVMVGGGSGAGQQAVLLAGGLTELRYSRGAEAEADAVGMDLLRTAGLSSQGMAPFFERMASDDGRTSPASAPAIGAFLSSHPDALRRAAAARSRQRSGGSFLTPQEWSSVKAVCGGKPSPTRPLA